MFQGCVAVISMTWITSLTLFAAMVLPRGGYYFNGTGLLACDPFFSRASLRILSSCSFYFPTTMILMYCYGSAFHVNKLRLKKVTCSAIASPDDFGGTTVEKVMLTRYTTRRTPHQRYSFWAGTRCWLIFYIFETKYVFL